MRFAQEISIFNPHAIEMAVVALGTRITQTAEEIRLEAAQTLSNYSTTVQMNAAISTKANEITSEVSQTYATQQSVNNSVSSLSTRITQNANSITSEVTARGNADSALSSRIAQTLKSISFNVTNNSTNTSATLSMSVTNEGGSTTALTSKTINLTGLVKFTDLSTSGSTTINGANIQTGTLSASKITSGTLSGDRISGGTITGTTISGGSIAQIISGAGVGGFSPTNPNNTQASINNGIVLCGELRIGAASDYRRLLIEGADDAGGYKGLLVNGHFSTYGCVWAGQEATDDWRVNCRGYMWARSYESSDRRLKHDIKPIGYADAERIIYGLSPVTFYLNSDKKQVRSHHGFIAQDAEALVLDDWGLITDGPDDAPDGTKYKGIAYTELIADLVAIVQSQDKRIKALEAQHG